jgi:hypothetical protein
MVSFCDIIWTRILGIGFVQCLVVKYELRFELRLQRNLLLRVITSNYVRNISHDSVYELLRHFLLRSPKYA